MGKCVVAFCDKRNKELTKRSFFAVPKDENMFSKWTAVLPTLRPLRPKDRVCCLHFDEKEIYKDFIHEIDGKIYQLQRGRKRLNPQAVPTLYLTSHLNLRRRIKISEIHQPAEVDDTINKNTISATETVEFLDMQNVVEKDCVYAEANTNFELVVSPPPIIEEHNCFEILSTSTIDLPSAKSLQPEHFNELFDEIFEIVLPNTLWGIHRCPKRTGIFFTYFDPNAMCTTKILSIDCNGLISAIYSEVVKYNVAISIDCSCDNIFGKISKILEHLDEISCS